MTTWTLDQIQQARGIRAKAEVDVPLLARHGDEVWESTRSKMFRHMTEIANTFALELDPRDVQFSKEDRDFRVVVVSWWDPQVRAVELRGGWKDGERVEYRDAPQPIRILKPPPRLMCDPMDTFPAPAEIADTYVCTGWHEQGRYWIYEAR